MIVFSMPVLTVLHWFPQNRMIWYDSVLSDNTDSTALVPTDREALGSDSEAMPGQCQPARGPHAATNHHNFAAGSSLGPDLCLDG